jgi:hypothetical protein
MGRARRQSARARPGLEGSFVQSTALLFAVAFLLLIPPTALMILEYFLAMPRDKEMNTASLKGDVGQIIGE